MINPCPFENVKVYDGVVQNVKFVMGRYSRPLWEQLDSLDIDSRLKWVDKISPFEAIACEWSAALCYEKKFGIKTTLRAEYLRALLLELQRLLWGFQYISRIFFIINDEVRVEQSLRLREYTLQAQEIFTGSRVLPQALCLGGVRRNLNFGDVRKFREILKNLEFEIRNFFKDLTSESIFSDRLDGVLSINNENARRIHLSGPIGQASGVHQDLRSDEAFGIYSEFVIKKFQAGQENNSFGDGLARVQSVLFQIRQSINLCYDLLIKMPEGEPCAKVSMSEKTEATIMAQVEGASGPIIATLAKNKLRISTQSMRLKTETETILAGGMAHDLELALYSLGFSLEEADLV